MNFKQLCSFAEFKEKLSEEPELLGSIGNDHFVYMYRVFAPEYQELHMIYSSVISSFGDVFEFTTYDKIKEVCIFIPSREYLGTIIITEDMNAIKRCEEWIDELSIFQQELRHCYTMNIMLRDFNEIDKISNYIPKFISQNSMAGGERRTPRIPTHHNPDHNRLLLEKIDPTLALEFISKFPEQTFSCSNTLRYMALKNAGVDDSRIALRLHNHSGRTLIQIASECPSMIHWIDDTDLFWYIVGRLHGKTKELLQLRNKAELRINYDEEDKALIDSCIAEYGSFDNAPEDVVDEIIERIFPSSELYEYMRPLIEFMDRNNRDIVVTSCLVQILFPEVDYSAGNRDDDEYIIPLYSENMTDYSKKEVLQQLSFSFDSYDMSQFYELYSTGHFTSKDIIKYGLHLIHPACLWMMNKINKTKSAQQMSE